MVEFDFVAQETRYWVKERT